MSSAFMQRRVETSSQYTSLTLFLSLICTYSQIQLPLIYPHKKRMNHVGPGASLTYKRAINSEADIRRLAPNFDLEHTNGKNFKTLKVRRGNINYIGRVQKLSQMRESPEQ